MSNSFKLNQEATQFVSYFPDGLAVYQAGVAAQKRRGRTVPSERLGDSDIPAVPPQRPIDESHSQPKAAVFVRCLQKSSEMKHDAHGWHILSADGTGNIDDTHNIKDGVRPGSSTAAIPQIKYVPRRDSFLVDDVSSLNINLAEREYHTLSETPNRSVYGYELPPATPRSEVDMVEYYQRRLGTEVERGLWRLGLDEVVHDSKLRFERWWVSAMSKKDRLGGLLQTKWKGLQLNKGD